MSKLINSLDINGLVDTQCQTFFTKATELMQTSSLEGARLFKFYIFIVYFHFVLHLPFLLNIHTYIHLLSKKRHLQGGLQVGWICRIVPPLST